MMNGKKDETRQELQKLFNGLEGKSGSVTCHVEATDTGRKADVEWENLDDPISVIAALLGVIESFFDKLEIEDDKEKKEVLNAFVQLARANKEAGGGQRILQ